MNVNSGYKNRLNLVGAIVATTFLTIGCAGSNFVRPDPGSFSLGTTTQQEISKRMGKPYRTGTLDKNGKTLQSATYAYANVGGEAMYSGVTTARSQGFYFLDSTLVGTEFTSSFKEDGTDFDAAKVPQIVKGKSTKADVVRVFGPAGGDYMYPLTANPTDRALVYMYSQTKGSAFNLRFYVKTLVVSYNASGVVTDVQYNAQGTKD